MMLFLLLAQPKKPQAPKITAKVKETSKLRGITGIEDEIVRDIRSGRRKKSTNHHPRA